MILQTLFNRGMTFSEAADKKWDVPSAAVSLDGSTWYLTVMPRHSADRAKYEQWLQDKKISDPGHIADEDAIRFSRDGFVIGGISFNGESKAFRVFCNVEELTKLAAEQQRADILKAATL